MGLFQIYQFTEDTFQLHIWTFHIILNMHARGSNDFSFIVWLFELLPVFPFLRGAYCGHVRVYNFQYLQKFSTTSHISLLQDSKLYVSVVSFSFSGSKLDKCVSDTKCCQ